MAEYTEVVYYIRQTIYSQNEGERVNTH
ncbi:uncharacterized protein G2W53_012569 [Senna tora]|uniref:Uncharacterized protein n=1 Tax=Senna tora TaxID=362788 RepID=A0A834U0T9_9FABA|nr:uncharacterized protein G2W53_012569 [Senna tora]